MEEENKSCLHLLPNPTKICDIKWKNSYKNAHEILSCTTLDSKSKRINLELEFNKISYNTNFKSHIARMLFTTKVITIPSLIDDIQTMDLVFEYLELLVTIFPMMAMIKDNEGDLPIHNLAEHIQGCINAKSSNFLCLVDALLAANPDHVLSLNRQGMTVAHILCTKKEVHGFTNAYHFLSRVLAVDPAIAR